MSKALLLPRVIVRFNVVLMSSKFIYLKLLVKKCWRRCQIDPVCRLHVTQREDLEPVGGLGIVAAQGGSVKSRHLSQICLGASDPQTIPCAASIARASCSPSMKAAKARTWGTLSGERLAVPACPVSMRSAIWLAVSR